MQTPRFFRLSIGILLLAAFPSFGELMETPAQGPGSETSQTIRVVAWNIEWYPGRRREADSAEAAAHTIVVKRSLPALQPDIFLVQEMRDWEVFADLCSAMEGLRPAVLSAFTQEETGVYWPQQVGIGSRLPVLAAWSEPWKMGEDVQPRRGFAAAALKLDSDRLLLVYSVHLKSNRAANDEEMQLNFRTREESARQIVDHVREMEEVVFPGRIAGVIVGGDFNTNQDGQFEDRTLAIMEEGGFTNTWFDTPRGDRLTWRGSQRFEPTTFDHIFVKGLSANRAQIVPTVDETSDHHPVSLIVEIPNRIVIPATP